MAFNDDFSGIPDGSNLNVSPDWTSDEDADIWRYIEKRSEAGVAYLFARSLGGSNNINVYTCPDQGNPDSYVQGRIYEFDGQSSWICALRINTSGNNNCVGWHLAGTGGGGLRLVKRVDGQITNLISTQGADKQWVRVEAKGEAYSLWDGGTGDEPGEWTQIGTDQIVPNSEVPVSSTSMGYVRIGTPFNVFLFEAFGAGPLGEGPPPSAGEAVNILVGGEWRSGVPHVLVNGEWRRAAPYVLNNGVWRPTVGGGFQWAMGYNIVTSGPPALNEWLQARDGDTISPSELRTDGSTYMEAVVTSNTPGTPGATFGAGYLGELEPGEYTMDGVCRIVAGSPATGIGYFYVRGYADGFLSGDFETYIFGTATGFGIPWQGPETFEILPDRQHLCIIIQSQYDAFDQFVTRWEDLTLTQG